MGGGSSGFMRGRAKGGGGGVRNRFGVFKYFSRKGLPYQDGSMVFWYMHRKKKIN